MNSPDMETAGIPTQKRSLFTWHTLRRVVIGIAWTATIIVVLYAFENWRCRRAWEHYHAAAEARGEHLDSSYFVPKEIPDDQNFFMAGSLPTTVFIPYHSGDNYKNFEWNDRFSWAFQRRVILKPGFRHLSDLATWEKALDSATLGSNKSAALFELASDPDHASRVAAAPGVLRGLQDCAGVLDEMQAASSRPGASSHPGARFPVEYDAENPAMIALPYLSILQEACVRLRLRASAELALGRGDDALRDLKLMFYLSDTIKNEPMLISGLVRVGLLTVQSGLIWEGLAEHDWTDAQLQQIQGLLLPSNYIADLSHRLAAERAASVAIAKYYGSRSDLNPMVHDLSRMGSESEYEAASLGPITRFLIGLMPRGWSYLELINVLKFTESRFDSTLDPVGKRVFPRILEANILSESHIPGGESVSQQLDENTPNEHLHPPDDMDDLEALLEHRFMERIWLSWGSAGLVRRFAAAQCTADQAAIACGLERYRLAKGSYPTDLNALVPAFIPALPNDVLTGEPYRYRRDSANMFTLYSVGWDLKDDDGKPSTKPYGPDGDWVWQ